MKEEIYVLAQSLQQPRVIKRIIEKSKEYKKVKVYGFKRDFYDVDNLNRLSLHPNIEIIIVGILTNEKYLHRLFLYAKLVFLLNTKAFFKKKDIYTFGLDLRAICCFLTNANVFYEIADIFWLYKSGRTRKFLSNLDFYLTKRSKLVYFTSEGFYKFYYSFLPPGQVVIIENKFKTYGKVKPVDNLLTDRIRVAYVGAFRYSAIISDLISVFKRNKNYELNFYGDGFNDIVEQIKKAADSNANIHYHGAFSNPGDLEGIYAQNNLNFVAYDNKLDNERVAMPNKYYESGFFNVPIVCAENTFVGQKVIEMQMGWVIEPEELAIEKFLDQLKIADLIACHERIKSLDKSLFESV